MKQTKALHITSINSHASTNLRNAGNKVPKYTYQYSHSNSAAILFSPLFLSLPHSQRIAQVWMPDASTMREHS